MAKGITSKGKPSLGGGPIKRASKGVKPTTATPGRSRSKGASLSKGYPRGTKPLNGGPITRGGSK